MRWLLSYKQPTTEVERTTLRIKADWSGNIYLPVCWYTTSGTQACTYNWKVKIDAGTETTYSGTWGANTNIKVWFWLKPGTTHTVEIKPVEDEYGWCRALCFKDSTYASSLINIISDKSYKGYAKSAEESGDYYKYYQYAWCVNLLDTDNEVLPDSVHYLGNNYRAYEYLGCTSLKGNAQEKIFKQVRKIWTNYRANQYQNCSWMTTVRMRAINWCSTGSGFRSNMLSWVGSSSNKATLIIEWGIVEWGSWWLTDANVNQVKVYKGLVNDYKTKLSWITASKIVNNPDWDTNNYEYLEFYINADANGDIKIPVAWYSNEWTQDCAYDWLVSVDGSDTTEYTGTGSASAITVGSWTAWSSHRILIYPKTEDWWWGRAFWFYNSGIASLLTEFIHDSFKCYADSYTDTWDYFRAYTFDGCVNLTNCYEKLPTSCDTLGDYYHFHDYDGCTSLEENTWEVIHNVSTMWESFRAYSFYNCSGLKIYNSLVSKPESISDYPTDYRKEMFGSAGNNLKVYMDGYEALASWLTNAMWLSSSNIDWVYCPAWYMSPYSMNSNWNNIPANKFKASYYDYPFVATRDVNKYTKLVWTFTVSWSYSPSRYFDFYVWQWGNVNRWCTTFSNDWYDVYLSWSGAHYTGAVAATLVRCSWKEWDSAVVPNWNNYYYNTGTVQWSYPYNWNYKAAYRDFGGNVILADWYKSGVSWWWYQNYKNKYTRWYIQKVWDWQSWQTWIWASKDWWWLFYDWIRYFASSRWWEALQEAWTYSPVYTNLEFSDDWYTAYLSTGVWEWTITQYNLTYPWNISTWMTSTGKTHSINGDWCFSKDWRYLFIYNWTLSVYEYEE